MALDTAKLLKTVGLVGKALVAVENKDVAAAVNAALDLVTLYGLPVPSQVADVIHTVTDNPKLVAAQILTYAPLLHLPKAVTDFLANYVKS